MSRYQPNDIDNTILKPVELLTAAEEIKLARRIAAGHQAANLQAARAHSPRQKVRLQVLIENGRAARNEMVERNLPLVKWTLKRYYADQAADDDLFEDGTLGLIHAAEKFDHRRGFRFATYAVWWIRQHIQRSRTADRMIRVPVHAQTTLNQIKRKLAEADQEHRRRPGPVELAEALCIPLASAKVYLNSLADIKSLEEPLGNDLTIGDTLHGGEAGEAGAEQKDTRRAVVFEIMQIPDSTVRTALLGYCGLLTGEPLTFEEMGAQLGVTRQCVQNYLASAREFFHNPARRDRLWSLLHNA